MSNNFFTTVTPAPYTRKASRMFQADVNRTVTQILLSLFASARTIERMPVARVYGPREVVSIVRTHTDNNRAGDYL